MTITTAIGATKAMEDYIAYILSIAGNAETLAPCYGIVPSDDLTEWNVLNEGASATNGRFVRLNNGTPVTQLNAGFTFAFAAFTNGFDGYSTSALLGNPSGTRFDGQVRDVVFFSSFLTAPQRRSWYDYLSGAVDDPPLPE